MERGATYDEALAEAQRLGFAEADPTEDVSGKDAAAKMAILATVAFGSRVTTEDVAYVGLERVAPEDVGAAREMGMAIRLVGAATLVGERWDVRVGPALVDREPPARRGRRRVQRGHAPGRRDPRDHARGARRRRARDGVGGGRRHGHDRRHDGHRLPPERRLLARARPPAGGRRVARRTTSASRSPTGPACSRSSRCGSRRRASRSRGSCRSRATGARRCTSSPTRLLPAGCVDALAEIDGARGDARGRRRRCR